MSKPQRTLLYDQQVALGARMVEFGGWEMPLLYPTGIVAEHLATRRGAGLFDVSHMGRFLLRGEGATAFLQHVLSSNAEALDVAEAQYTVIPTETGGAVDDAYLYRFVEDEYLLVVNAANRQKDREYLHQQRSGFTGAELSDVTDEIIMLALQGPESRAMLLDAIESGTLPEPKRNALSTAVIGGVEIRISRTGYTGEPLCFELFAARQDGLRLWEALATRGATPVGLGARDTLRLEAALPLYGHELGEDAEGREIPVMACPSARLAVSLSPRKGDFVGRAALLRQHEAYRLIRHRDYSLRADLPRMIQPLAVVGRGAARAGAKVFKGERPVGYVTSGTMVPFWSFEDEGLTAAQSEKHELRSIALAYLDSDIVEDEKLTAEVRGERVEAVVVPYHLRSEAPPLARPIVTGHEVAAPARPADRAPQQVRRLIEKAAANTEWRQRDCINLIPSEMTPSPMVRLLSVMDPAFRYAEHRPVKAFYDADVFYYQGVDFIAEVERLLEAELCRFLGCAEVETRLISGQMANAAVYSGMVDYLNQADRKPEPRRIGGVMNHLIGKGGHLSAQPMGALRDYLAHDPRTERPAVVNFPVLADNPYQVDVPAALELIAEYRPELIIFGRSMALHKEPVAEIRQFVDAEGLDTVLMYDMAHVLGLAGRHFQEPFGEGADLVSGSTHKTFFGTQRGIVGSRFSEGEERYDLWEAIRRRTFPGSVSNHHLGTMVGLLMAAYEMNHFKDEYQAAVISNAKALARALKEGGLDVAGDPSIDFTETHQVIVRVGYGRGPEVAGKLEASNIICNYQAAPDEEGFTAAGALRLGVAEMTRFGMAADDFRALASLLAEVVLEGADVAEEARGLRRRFQDLRFRFSGSEYDDLLEKLHALLR